MSASRRRPPPAGTAAAPDPDGGRRLAGRARVGAALLVGVALLVASRALVGEGGDVPRWEADAFHAVNDLPDALRWPLWPIMQLGTLWVVGLGAAVAYALTRRWQPATATAGAVLAAWVAARAVKESVGRGRPADLLDDVHVRGPGHDTPGYVSGHTAVAFAAATVLTPLVPPRWRGAPLALAVLVGLSRIFFGAHLPLDVIGGAGVGILCGLVAMVAGGALRPGRRPPEAG